MARPIRLCPILIGAAALGAAHTPAEARENAADLQVNVAIVDGCTVTTTDVAFGLIIGTRGTLRSTGTVDVQCTANLDFAISMDRGQHSQGINRRMRNATSGAYMRYNLYSDPAYSRRWTDQRAGQVRGNSGSTGSIAFPVYGELTFDGSAVTGRYEDSVTVTVEF